jgi:hypothetical protein
MTRETYEALDATTIATINTLKAGQARKLFTEVYGFNAPSNWNGSHVKQVLYTARDKALQAQYQVATIMAL